MSLDKGVQRTPAPPTKRISKTITQRWIPASSPPSTQYDKAALNPKTPPALPWMLLLHSPTERVHTVIPTQPKYNEDGEAGEKSPFLSPVK